MRNLAAMLHCAIVRVCAPFGIALDGLRAHGVRAGLAAGGVAIGIAPVLVIVTMITGARASLAKDFGQVSRDAFVVARSELAEETSTSERPMYRPPITLDEVEMLGRLPDIASASASIEVNLTIDHRGDVFREVEVQGTAAAWPESHDGEFLDGRNFVVAEEQRGAYVAVISSALSRRLSGDASPIGETFQLEGLPFRVVGVYRETPSLLTDTSSFWVRTPYSTALHALPTQSEWLEVRVTPQPGTTRELAEESVISAMRSVRRLQPRQGNNFTIVGREGVEELFAKYAGTLSAAMILLTSLGLLVGGVGLVGILTVSISERTQEIGIRRAMGATRFDIVMQFLVEASAITVAGSIVGLAVAALATLIIRTVTPVPGEMPAWAFASTVLTAAISGLGLGLYPAIKAARLDPAAALRNE
ncbi:MAG: ABC transporter permease [bacterium]